MKWGQNSAPCGSSENPCLHNYIDSKCNKSQSRLADLLLSIISVSLQEPTRITSEISSDPNAGPQLVIWGTDVVVSHCKEKFKRFICKYVDTNVADDEQFEGMDISQPYYLQRLEEVMETCDKFK